MNGSKTLLTGAILSALVLAVFGILQWLGVEAGRFIDWVVGAASFVWLVAIVTIPWNIYFRAREVQRELETSRERGIEINESRAAYVGRTARRGLIVALLLHTLSALALAALSWFELTPVGYITSALALLLTALRPSVRAYQYIWHQLHTIEEESRYPREDLVSWGFRLDNAEESLRLLTERHHDARTAHEEHLATLTQQLDDLSRRLDTLHHDNEDAHERMTREQRRALEEQAERLHDAVRGLSRDSQFLEHMRELIRFFKEA